MQSGMSPPDHGDPIGLHQHESKRQESRISSSTAETARVGGRYAVQGHSRSLTDVSTNNRPLKIFQEVYGTNRKPICDFLLVNNINLHLSSHIYPVIGQYTACHRN